MAKPTTQFVCQSCGNTQGKWSGKCDNCGAWNSFVEEAGAAVTGKKGSPAHRLATSSLAGIDLSKQPRIDTGMPEVNQVLGGGMVPGSVMLLSGDPGIGKSTLVLQLAALLSTTRPVLYVSGEESASQIKLRADRLGVGDSSLELLTETDVDSIVATVEAGDYGLVIIDSIQTMTVGMLTGSPGTVGQITASAQMLSVVAKRKHAAMILIGHVT